eukprot:Blabericola_migrator_1__8476@NODE_441_length_8449_cov_49_535552_g346_i0_p1_GENE_NODE_441_length_8449_cov_49_535552_g346_i0NODE_441_length_8449_cov_49_535552_g346_i0_p1_ORF_typecomplete_len473_score104_76zfZPR1/PF03367_13/1_6e54zfZPR1/PF03367_13/2_8e48OrfB_Zn_ribbon/PF07282_11/50OrfB_Zn_ribbon/PF07282_11/37RNA_POL_M_15KD/PF02150_16/4_3RNA_POL_M_15KD/PF02150_16/1e03RNA_POL_M_15KD/PF02150_16/1_1e02Elf1/PF05129_13/9_3Elf1/PF05129_13/42zincribbons_6/PF07191_12/4_3zincribbons_6/PF07191_12/1_8e02_NODE_
MSGVKKTKQAMSAAEDEVPFQTIESLCVNCEKNGVTRLMLTKVPYFQDVVISSFECPHCNYQNNGVQMAGGIQAMGEKIQLTCTSSSDLDRQLIKSEHASVSLPELEFEIPAQTQKGSVSTVQGVINQAVENLEKDQPVRRHMTPDIAKKIDAVIQQLRAIVGGEKFPFIIVVDDPAGNSFIENPSAPKKDPNMISIKYPRTREQLHQLGFFEEQSADVKPGADLPADLKAPVWDLDNPMDDDEADKRISFGFECCHCGKQGVQNMCEIDIPGFRRCIVMAFVCDNCGARSNEVKPGGPYGEKARRWTLKVESVEDLNRDVLKSDVAGLEIPEIELTLEAGTLGGVFTTVEGLLVKIADELAAKNPFVGDSVTPEQRARIETLITAIRERAAGKHLPFTFILDDPADQSHIGRRGGEVLNLIAQSMSGGVINRTLQQENRMPDAQMTTVQYPRTQEQNEDLGLAYMKTENYC